MKDTWKKLSGSSMRLFQARRSVVRVWHRLGCRKFSSRNSSLHHTDNIF